MAEHEMKIALGMDRSDDPDTIRELIALGADEFFAGYIPVEWYNRYGWEVSINRRENGPVYQFTRFQDLARAAAVVHENGGRFFLTFNAHDYDMERLLFVRDVIRDVDTLEPDGYIVADPALMLEMREWGIERPLHLSTGAGCFNTETVRWYHDTLDFKRVVIPRKLTVPEIERFVPALADLDLDFEVMIIGPRCFYNDEYCFTLHTGNLPNFCNLLGGDPLVQGRFPRNWKQELTAVCTAPENQVCSGSALDEFLKQITWEPPPGSGRPPETGRSTASIAGMHPDLAAKFYMHCGLCAIAYLRRAGVRVLKVPVRGSSWAKKNYVRLVRAVADHPSPTPAVCRELMNAPAYCAQPESCYYAIPDA